MKHLGRRSTLVLTELIVDLCLFAVCAAVCVALLVHARGMSLESTRLTQAVYLAQSAAELWRAGDVDGETMSAGSQTDENGLTVSMTSSGNTLDVAVYWQDELVYALEGVTRLG